MSLPNDQLTINFTCVHQSEKGEKGFCDGCADEWKKGREVPVDINDIKPNYPKIVWVDDAD